ncbi:MAG: SDR family oxidoreductase [Dehalococcoidales bacterium]|nr:SDR family oxidoreductase [Dehalococcoidales bacterium]
MEQKRSELKGKNILVTGGAGFIGSNLVDRLSLENKVVVLDNLSSGLLTNLSKSMERITFIKGDILDKELLEEVVAKVEFVFHLAANVGNVKSIEDPHHDMEVNIAGTINLLEVCSKSNIKRLVYSSSGAIFGEAKYLPIDEDHPINPESPYGVSKLAAEKYCFAFHKVHGLPITALRYFNAYGPRQGSSAYPNVIAIFSRRIKEGKPFTIYGDGEQTRDFLFVGDIVRANILAATHPAAVGEIFNIATGQENSVNQLVSIINQISGKQNKVIYADLRAGEVRHSRANIEKAQKILGYNPETSIKEGLLLTWKEEIAGRNAKGEKV